MYKQFIIRAFLGIPIGMAISSLIAIVISLIMAEGYFYPCSPELTLNMGSELKAVLLQTILSAFLGAIFAGSSIIWEIEHWGIARQSATFFLITSLTMMPIAYILNWMKHSLAGFIAYFSIYVASFIVIWVIQYLIYKRQIASLNHKLK